MQVRKNVSIDGKSFSYEFVEWTDAEAEACAASDDKAAWIEANATIIGTTNLANAATPDAPTGT